jgi:hypothetical protein
LNFIVRSSRACRRSTLAQQFSLGPLEAIKAPSSVAAVRSDALHAECGVRHGIQSLLRYRLSAFGTEPEAAALDAVQRGLDRPELRQARAADRFQDFFALPLNSPIRVRRSEISSRRSSSLRLNSTVSMSCLV